MKPEQQRLAVAGLLQKQRGGAPDQWSIDVRRREGSKGADGRWLVTGLALERAALHKLLQPLAGGSLHAGLGLPQALAMDALLRRELRAVDAAAEPGTSSSSAARSASSPSAMRRARCSCARCRPICRAAPTAPSTSSGWAPRSSARTSSRSRATTRRACSACWSAAIPRWPSPWHSGWPRPTASSPSTGSPSRPSRWRTRRRAGNSCPLLAGAVAALEGALFSIMPRRRQDSALWRLRRYALTGRRHLLPWPAARRGRRRRAHPPRAGARARTAGRPARAEPTGRRGRCARLHQAGGPAGAPGAAGPLHSPERTPLGPLLRDMAARLPRPGAARGPGRGARGDGHPAGSSCAARAAAAPASRPRRPSSSSTRPWPTRPISRAAPSPSSCRSTASATRPAASRA